MMTSGSRHRCAPAWRPAPAAPTLGPDEVHVWRAALDVAGERVHGLLETLSPDERARSQRLRRGRERFVVARGVLRVILARYLGTSPARLMFRTTANGKPELAGAWANALAFNISHSEGLALYAVSRQRAVGIDVERIRPDVAEESIAERFFASSETQAIRALPLDRQAQAFFACWTQKEAILKAIGCGLTARLDQYEVSVSTDEPAAILRLPSNPEAAGPWSLRRLRPGAGYAAAVAIKGDGGRLLCWDWSHPTVLAPARRASTD